MREETGTIRVLVFAAHPDDEVLGMGGTIANHALVRGDPVRVVCLTDGSSTQYPGDPERRRQKDEEALKAAAVLGVTDYVHLDFPDMRLDTVPHVEINHAVETQLLEFDPDVVYSVHPDVNRDHRAVFESVSVATRPAQGSRVTRILTYAPLSSTEWTPPATGRFIPDWYVDISGTIGHKIDAFDCYTTEHRPYPHPRNGRAIRAAAEYFGMCCGCEFAEPFALVREIRREDARGLESSSEGV